MKPLTFVEIEEVGIPREGETIEPVPTKSVTFCELEDSGDKKHRTEIAVETHVYHENAANFSEISDVEEEDDELDSRTAASSTVLVVEDDNIVSTMLKHLLERRGYSIEIAADGRRAAELIESDFPPALVILDVMLPFVDGFELIRQIRQNAGWEKVPIIMLTAKTREQDIVRALESGADDYIIKPFQPQELLARVNRFVTQK